MAAQGGLSHPVAENGDLASRVSREAAIREKGDERRT